MLSKAELKMLAELLINLKGDGGRCTGGTSFEDTKENREICVEAASLSETEINFKGQVISVEFDTVIDYFCERLAGELKKGQKKEEKEKTAKKFARPLRD